MVGLIDKVEHVTTQWFKDEGDAIILVGEIGNELGGSRYLKVCHGKKIGPVPHVDLAREIEVQNATRELIRAGVIKSAHDCSEGGLAVALAESCFNPQKLFGAEVDLARTQGSISATWPGRWRYAEDSRKRSEILLADCRSSRRLVERHRARGR